MNLKDTIFRVIDTETTSREPSEARVCEIAWRDVDFAGAVHGEFSALCNPGVPIPPDASAIHHLVDEHVAGRPPVDDYMDLLQAEVYVAHSADYDRAVLGRVNGHEDLLHDGPVWICTHRLAKHLWPEIKNHSNQEIRYTLKLKVDLPNDTPAHRAEADVAVTAAILKVALPLALAKWPHVETVEQLVAEIAKPCRLIVVPFKSAGGVKFEDADTGLLEWILQKDAGGEDVVHTARLTLQERYKSGAVPDEFVDDDQDELF